MPLLEGHCYTFQRHVALFLWVRLDLSGDVCMCWLNFRTEELSDHQGQTDLGIPIIMIIIITMTIIMMSCCSKCDDIYKKRHYKNVTELNAICLIVRRLSPKHRDRRPGCPQVQPRTGKTGDWQRVSTPCPNRSTSSPTTTSSSSNIRMTAIIFFTIIIPVLRGRLDFLPIRGPHILQ